MQIPSLISKAKHVKLLILDVDGILTDGVLYFGDTKEYMKAFHVHDGLGLRLLLSTNVSIAIITAKQSCIVTTRLQALGITDIHQGVQDKLAIYNQLLTKYHLSAKEVAFMGDDLPDLQTLKTCGLSISVPNAYWVIKRHVDMITQKDGGAGAVREVCDFIMQAKGTFNAALAPFEAITAHD